jgi:hypothetical protein
MGEEGVPDPAHGPVWPHDPVLQDDYLARHGLLICVDGPLSVIRMDHLHPLAHVAQGVARSAPDPLVGRIDILDLRRLKVRNPEHVSGVLGKLLTLFSGFGVLRGRGAGSGHLALLM